MNRRHWLEVMAHCEIMPQVQQDEYHPYRMNEYNKIFCEQNHIHFEAFLPVARDLLRDEPILVQLAEKYNKSTFQIILRWDIQHGVTTIPRSSNPKHIADNVDIYDFELTDEEMTMIDSLNEEGIMNRDMDNFNF